MGWPIEARNWSSLPAENKKAKMTQGPHKLLRIEAVHKVFELGGKKVEALKGVSVEVNFGDMIAVVGASGAGKTTLLQLIGTLDRPSAGFIYYRGNDLFSMPESELLEFRNKKIGFIFQFHHLLPEFSALENVMMPALIGRVPRAEARRAAEEILVELGLKDRLEHRPGQLSGGEQQRVAVARALVNRPELVLADEPTGNLDSVTGTYLYELFRRLNEEKGHTFITVTHNTNLASMMDRMIWLADGKVQRDGRE